LSAAILVVVDEIAHGRIHAVIESALIRPLAVSGYISLQCPGETWKKIGTTTGVKKATERKETNQFLNCVIRYVLPVDSGLAY
jgi:hypothetical protein